jgi:hypothetical protein
MTHRLLWQLCLNGREPAESLPTNARERLVRLLHARGWSDVQIADWTRMSTYTTGRIRTRLELAPNREQARRTA